ncbi:MAG: hypothetical protein ACI9UT_002833 [Flavobacteriales bacterium]|jgi:hypothetical protein
MTVVNIPTSHNKHAEVANSDTLMMEKNLPEENNMSFRTKVKELDDGDSSCFVLGYN